MLQEIVMPQLGLTMTEGAVSAWLKKPGDRVERGEILFLVQTDKVEMEVESFVSGLLDNILVEPDVVVKVGTVIATVEDGRAAKSPAPAINLVAAPPRETIPKADVVSTKVVSKREVPISPRAKKLASSLGIDVALLTPSKGDRITEEDVRNFQEKAVAKPNRAVIAQRMTSSFHSAPHFYLTAHVDVTVWRKCAMPTWPRFKKRMASKSHIPTSSFARWQSRCSKNPGSIHIGNRIE